MEGRFHEKHPLSLMERRTKVSVTLDCWAVSSINYTRNPLMSVSDYAASRSENGFQGRSRVTLRKVTGIIYGSEGRHLPFLFFRDIRVGFKALKHTE